MQILSNPIARVIPEYTALPYLPLNLKPAVVEQIAAAKQFMRKHRKPVLILSSLLILQVIFGFDPKFCLINIIWLFV